MSATAIVLGANSSLIGSLTVTILAIGAMMAAFARKIAANRELHEAREELAELAVSEERLRIARDMHDLLGHSLSVIALKSELAARLLEHDPARAAGELEDIQTVTRQALAEVREAVQGYRRQALADALERARAALGAAGIDCELDGTPVGLPGRRRVGARLGRARGHDQRRAPQRGPALLDPRARRGLRVPRSRSRTTARAITARRSRAAA